MHRALREALINALVHSDYSDRASVLVIKRPSGFVFRNPGGLRVPAAQALQGGESDCRNRTLHQMFLMIGLGERAGSGLPKIRQGWEINGGTLKLFDSYDPYDQTRLEMIWGFPGEASIKTPGKTLRKTPGKTPERILELLSQSPHLSIPEIAARLEKSESAIERAIRKLRSTGQLIRVGPDKGGYWKVLE